jgi:hypothetical protein
MIGHISGYKDLVGIARIDFFQEAKPAEGEEEN